MADAGRGCTAWDPDAWKGASHFWGGGGQPPSHHKAKCAPICGLRTQRAPARPARAHLSILALPPPILPHRRRPTMARPMKSRAALAAAAALALLLAWAAPSAAQDAVDFAAVDFAATTGEQLQADAPSSPQFVVVDVVHTSRVNIKKAMATRTIKERSLQLTREQVASLLAASSAAPAADAPGVESAASYAPESGGAVPLSQVRADSRTRGAAAVRRRPCERVTTPFRPAAMTATHPCLPVEDWASRAEAKCPPFRSNPRPHNSNRVSPATPLPTPGSPATSSTRSSSRPARCS